MHHGLKRKLLVHQESRVESSIYESGLILPYSEFVKRGTLKLGSW